MTWRRTCEGAADCVAAGRELAALLEPGDIVLLNGPLGAGKTTFVKGVAAGLGVSERVTSPTFTIVREHRCRNERGITTLHHCDVYRIERLDEVVDLALGELVEDDAVALIEWGELAAPVLGPDVMVIDFEVRDETRVLHVGGEGALRRRDALERWAS